MSKVFQECINTIFSKCQQLATEVHSEEAIKIYRVLIVFVANNRLDYLSDFLILYHEFIQSDYSNINYRTLNTKRIDNLKRRIFDYKQKAQYYLKENKFEKQEKFMQKNYYHLYSNTMHLNSQIFLK
jgi:hypothetical protein